VIPRGGIFLPDFAVIFDSDGVVVDSEPFSLASFRQAMAEQGISLSDEDIMANCGLTDADIVDYVFRKFSMKVDQQVFHDRKHELYEQKVREGDLKPCDGAIELISSLQTEKIPYALASSGSRKKIRFNLTRVGLFDMFPVVISGEDMERGKPFPDIFLAAARRLETPPERCAAIEDSLNGIEAVHRAGMKSVAVSGTFPADRLGKADFIVESLEQLTVKSLQILIHGKKPNKGG